MKGQNSTELRGKDGETHGPVVKKGGGEIIGDEEYDNSCKIYVVSNREVT